MNKFQRIVVIIAAVNIALMLAFPPFLDNPIRRGVLPGFEGFYPLFTAYGIKNIHSELLTLQIMFVVINTLIAWLVLDRPQASGVLPELRYTRAIGLFLLGNLVFLFLFPPFETYASLFKFEQPSFDSFYFIFGDKHRRNFFIPLLYMEVLLVVINALTLWLLFNTVQRSELLAREKLLRMARKLPPEQQAEVSRTLGYKAVETTARDGRHERHMGSGPDRRRYKDPRYAGPERRRGGDRRFKTRTS